MSAEPSGFVGRNEGTDTGTGEGEREYATLSRLPDFSVGETRASTISTSPSRWTDSLSDEDSDSEDPDEDGESPETAAFVGTCVFNFTIVGFSSSESEALPSEEDEGSEEETVRLFLFLFRFLAGFAVAAALAALF